LPGFLTSRKLGRFARIRTLGLRKRSSLIHPRPTGPRVAPIRRHRSPARTHALDI
jgi:hypothetical protein